MEDANCTVDRCPEEAIARDMCRRHYQRWYRYGDPLALMILPEAAGIYRINGPAGGSYVGSAKNLRDRWKRHKAELRRGVHHNRNLQLLWDAFGEACFTVAVLEEVPDPAGLIDAENRWLRRASADGEIFNISADARSPFLGMTHTTESRAKMSASTAAAVTPEVRAAMRQRTRGTGNPGVKLGDADVLEICKRLLAGEHAADLASAFGVTQETVYQIRSGRTWTHLVPSETVAAMRAIRQNPWASGRRTVTDEHRERFAAVGRSNKDKILPEERREEISRQSRGSGNPKARLSEDQAAVIILRLASGALAKDLAAEYGVSLNTIWRIKNRETWTHLTGEPRVNGNKGKSKSDEHRAKLSAAQKAFWESHEIPPDIRERMIEGGRMTRGRKRSAETRQRMSEAQKGKTLSPEHLANLRAAKKGARGPGAKLDEDKAREIKRRFAVNAKESCAALGREFGVSPLTISDIKHGRTWRDITIE